MNIYANSLRVLKSLLEQSRILRWAEHLGHDIEAWDNFRSTERHRHSYGGMGSLNDVTLPVSSLRDVWANNLLEAVKLVTFEFSHHGKVDLVELFSKLKPLELTGSICVGCRHAEVTEVQLEHALSSYAIPVVAKEFLPDDLRFLKLTNVAELLNEARVTEMRRRFLSGLADAGIAYNVDRKTRMKPCPKCNAADTMVYRWDVAIGNQVTFIGSKGNLLMQ